LPSRFLGLVVLDAKQDPEPQLRELERLGTDDIARARGDDDEVAARFPPSRRRRRG
jgi:hypothetical protein